MIDLNEIFTIDLYLQKYEEIKDDENFTIKEIAPANDGVRRFMYQYIEDNQNHSNEIEYYALLNWFDTFYTQHEKKYRRLMSLNKLDDDGINAKAKLDNLYELAEKNRLRIQELENIVTGAEKLNE